MSRLQILKFKLPFNILRTLYLSLADSIISYCLSSYGRTFTTNINKIYELQRRILKTIVPPKIKQKYTHNELGLFHYCKTLTVHDKIELCIVDEEYSRIPSLEKKSRPKNLRTLNYLPTYVTPRYNNTYGQRTWEYMLPSILNRIPKITVDSLTNNVSKRKAVLKAYYFSCYIK